MAITGYLVTIAKVLTIMFDRILKSRFIPVTLQILSLSVFALFIYIGWGVTSDDSTFLLTLRNTNLANLFVWCFWWPGIIVVSVLFGRLWCTICPMELVASLLNRIGLKLKVPHFFRSGWIITLFYLTTLIIGVHTFSIHRVPHRMAIYLILLFGVTIVASLLFEKRAFCTYICPVGHLLGLYASVSSMEWRVKDHAVCTACNGKPCVNKSRNYSWYGRACQSNLFPGSLKDNRDCILCTQCMKACPHDNVTFRFRSPFKDIKGKLTINAAQMLFFTIVFGFAFYEVVTEWSAGKALLLAPANALNAYLNTPAQYNGSIKATLLFVLLPALLLCAVTLAQSGFRLKNMLATFSTYIAAFIPLIATTHVAKSVVKSVSRFQYVPGAFTDSNGVETAKALTAGTLSIGGPWQGQLNLLARSGSVIVLILGFAATIYLLNSYARNSKRTFPALYALLAFAYAFCTAGALIGKMFF